jgi:hypothetical protein
MGTSPEQEKNAQIAGINDLLYFTPLCLPAWLKAGVTGCAKRF